VEALHEDGFGLTGHLWPVEGYSHCLREQLLIQNSLRKPPPLGDRPGIAT
jgi:hypothetical protein